MSILSFLKSKLKISDPNDYDTKTNYQILKADFLLMIAGVGSYKGTPSKVFIRVNGIKTSYYVTYPKYEALKVGWDAFIQMNQREPNFITINKVAPIVKPYPIPDIEKLSGMTINSMTDLYDVILKIGVYNHINCLQGANTDTIVKGIPKQYNNCARYAYLAKKCSDAFNSIGKKYTTRIVHVECENSKHFPDPNAGHFFVFIQGEEFPVKTCFDLAEAASGKRGIGSTMCVNGYSIIGYDKLC